MATARRQEIIATANQIAVESSTVEDDPASVSEWESPTELWKARIQAASTIEEVSRLEVAFKRLKSAEKEYRELWGFGLIRAVGSFCKCFISKNP